MINMKTDELNEKIKDQEFEILNLELDLVKAKHEYDKAVFSEVLMLEKEYATDKNKELSTAGKRESIANNKPHIKELKEKLSQVDISIREKKIYLKYQLRQFKILTTEVAE